MTTGHGQITEAGTIRFERVLPGPVERVWAYLTDSAKRAKWLAAGPMELRVGGKVDFTFHNSDLGDGQRAPAKYAKYEACTLAGTVTRCEPMRVLSHTWGDGEDHSEVTYELTERGGEVVLVLTHRRLATRDGMLNVAGGWHTHLDVLDAVLRNVSAGGFWTKFERMEGEYRGRIPEEAVARG